jgi:hypothetical protein
VSFTRLNGQSLVYPPKFWADSTVTTYNHTLNAANEIVHFVGQIMIEGGPDAGSKTVSAAGGGKILWRTNTVIAFSNASTNLRIGLQDLDVTSQPAHGDHTFDVYADLVGGTDSLVSNDDYETAMESGTKTLSHGDFVAVAFEFTSHGGSDYVSILSMGDVFHDDTTPGLPGVWLDDGSPAVANGVPCCAIQFDDGTLGWISGGAIMSFGITSSFAVNTSGADEYGNLITPEFDIIVSGVTFSALVQADLEICLYSDPLGTPTLLEALSVDESGTMINGSEWNLLFASEHTLRAGQSYGITMRPTTTTSSTLYGRSIETGSLSSYLKVQGMSDETYHAIKRLDNSGAFSVAGYGGSDKNVRYCMIFNVCGLRTRKGIATAAIGL